jgi:hypothetical protein
MYNKVEPSVIVVLKAVPLLLMDTSKQKPPIVVDGTTCALEKPMQYDGRSPYWDEDE